MVGAMQADDPRSTLPREAEHDPAADGAMVVANPVVRALLLGLGFLSVGMGVIGIFVPGWPTTVWILIAAFFFARSSTRFYAWLLRHRLFGKMVRDYRAGLGIPLRVKVFAISMIVLFAGSSTFLMLSRPWIAVIIGALGAFGIGYLLRVPTKHPEPAT